MLSGVVRFYARKMFKRAHFMSPCKMINLLQNVMTNLSPKKFELYGRWEVFRRIMGVLLWLQISTLCLEKQTNVYKYIYIHTLMLNKYFILMLQHFFWHCTYSVTSIFLVMVQIYKTRVFDQAFFPLCNCC